MMKLLQNLKKEQRKELLIQKDKLKKMLKNKNFYQKFLQICTQRQNSYRTLGSSEYYYNQLENQGKCMKLLILM